MPGRTGTGVVLLLLLAAAGWWYLPGQVPQVGESAAGGESSLAGGKPSLAAEAAGVADAVQRAFEERARGRVIAVHGRVERNLSDDRDGSPHQRFIIRTDSGLTLLVAHNLDLAPRLQGLAPGDAVTVLGEYEWNEQGGLMHWTHDDPQRQHVAGYIEWRGKRYQ